jgi:uncharacterized coiled-coil protein SlyX
VVQQRQGRVAPEATLQGNPVNQSEPLEREAWQLGRAAARGERARAGGGGGRAAGDPVIQGAFTAQAIIAAKNPANEEQCAADQLQVDQIQIPQGNRPRTKLENRPTTEGKIDKDRQGAHTLPWSWKAAQWAGKLKGKSYKAALGELWAMAQSDRADDQETEAAALRARLMKTLQEMNQQGLRKPISYWQSSMSWAITAYARTYQKASFAVWNDKDPKGHGEEDAALVIDDVENRLGLQPMTVTNTEGENALVKARKMADVHASMSNRDMHAVFVRWLELLKDRYPRFYGRLRTPTNHDVDQILTGGLAAFNFLREQMKFDISLQPATVPATAKTVGNENIVAQGFDAEKENAADPDTRFVVGVKLSGATQAYLARDLTVTSLSLSDERPATRFGSTQQSHTIPWSLNLLVWTKLFSGKRLDKILKTLRERLESDQSMAGQRQEDAGAQRRAALLHTVMGEEQNQQQRTIPAWTDLLNRMIQEYVEIYQLSSFAVFPTPVSNDGSSRASSHGEAASLKALNEWNTAGAVSGDDVQEGNELISPVRAVARRLIDLPGDPINQQTVNVSDLKDRWKQDFGLVYDKIGNHDGDLDQAYDDVASKAYHEWLKPVEQEVLTLNQVITTQQQEVDRLQQELVLFENRIQTLSPRDWKQIIANLTRQATGKQQAVVSQRRSSRQAGIGGKVVTTLKSISRLKLPGLQSRYLASKNEEVLASAQLSDAKTRVSYLTNLKAQGRPTGITKKKRRVVKRSGSSKK